MSIPRLHPDTTEEVKQRADIVDIISESVVLRKRGKDYLGLCPFHDEKTPSFSVSPSKQLYYCFGCGAGGNVFKFMMELGQTSFSEVVIDLARRYQVSVKTLEPQQHQELQRQLSLKEQLYEILAVATSFYQHALRQPEGEVALNYLYSERKLSEETIQSFQLGVAPAGWDTLYRYLVEQKRFSVELVKQAGLIKERKSGNGYYDAFRDRLMIPIHDSQGRVIAFGSRTLSGEEPKYLNSPDTPLFDKGKTLFALDKARQEIAKQDFAVVVEGYFDAIALHSVGIRNAVASLGTAFSQEQLKQVLRYTESKQLIFNFDADTAGTKATQRAIQEIEPLVYSGQVQLRVLNLPGGKDADEYLKSSADAPQLYRQQLLEAPLWLDWQINQVLHTFELKDAFQVQQAVKKLIGLLSNLESAELRTHYVKVCAQKLSQDDSQLMPSYAQMLFRELKKPVTRANSLVESKLDIPLNSQQVLLEQAESLLLKIYIHYPEYRQKISQTLEDRDLLFSLAPHRFLWQQILQRPPTITANELISQMQDLSYTHPEILKQLTCLFHPNEIAQWVDSSRFSLEIDAAIASLEKVTWEKHKHYCQKQVEKTDQKNNPENWQYYYQEYHRAKQKIIEIDCQRSFSLIEIVKLSSV